jgi:MFS family permease
MSARLPFAQRYGNLVAAIATIAACDISMGLSFSLIPLILESRGTAASLIGFNAAMGPLGIIIAGPFLPRLVSHFGSKRVVWTVIAVIIASLLAFNLTDDLIAWFVLRFIFGIAVGTLFTVSEAWILSFAEQGNRGRIMAIYTSVLSITFAFGPLIIPFTGIEGWLPWLIGIAFLCLSVFPLLFVKPDENVFAQKEGTGFIGFFGRAPLLLFAVASVTLSDQIILSFFQIWGIRNGLSLEMASWLLGFGIIGNALLQYPVGMLADRWSRMGVVILAGIVTIVFTISLNWVVSSWLIWPVMLILGTSYFAIYTVSLAVMGDNFKGPDLIAGSAAFSAMWGIGGIVGPSLAGVAVDIGGINTVPYSVATPFVILLIGLALMRGSLIRKPAHG